MHHKEQGVFEKEGPSKCCERSPIPCALVGILNAGRVLAFLRPSNRLSERVHSISFPSVVRKESWSLIHFYSLWHETEILPAGGITKTVSCIPLIVCGTKSRLLVDSVEFIPFHLLFLILLLIIFSSTTFFSVSSSSFLSHYSSPCSSSSPFKILFAVNSLAAIISCMVCEARLSCAQCQAMKAHIFVRWSSTHL